jgi:hypothetical protein
VVARSRSGGPGHGAAEAQHVKRRRHPARGEPLSWPGWLRRPSSSRWVPRGLLREWQAPGCGGAASNHQLSLGKPVGERGAKAGAGVGWRLVSARAEREGGRGGWGRGGQVAGGGTPVSRRRSIGSARGGDRGVPRFECWEASARDGRREGLTQDGETPGSLRLGEPCLVTCVRDSILRAA